MTDIPARSQRDETSLDAARRLALRNLPSVNALLTTSAIQDAAAEIAPAIATEIIRRHIEATRAQILAGQMDLADDLQPRVLAELALLTGRVSTTVINASGVILQTNLGRAPVSRATAEAMQLAAANYLPLEMDLESGQRGGRGQEVSALMRALTRAEQTLVVNNNAAAVLLTLSALTSGKRVLVSRSEAVEIGGGFRIPDVLQQSGAILVEVGTTNRTYLRDYESVIDADTVALLRVHTSNFAIVGFTSKPSLHDLADLAHAHGLLAIEDVGSGCLLDTQRYGLDHEPTLRESIAHGLDVVCASGDKLLGGPQAGLIMGRADVVQRIARHPLARAMRADKTCLAGLAATLRHYLRNEAEAQIPVWWSISRSSDWLRGRASNWALQLGNGATVIATDAVVGGGSLPGKTLPSWAVALQQDRLSAEDLAHRLRCGTPSVVPRIVDEQVLLDARTVLATQDDALLQAVRRARTG